ncbi:MAG: hypothetical protein AVDCRST_MAG41-1305 [uncultured Corynebacteriales bacterium]|uniref:Uncharacterized protein n=1 Tax=uncultured Mycobacteriales bacterium TaxID=581187 RepID=A0A6J4I1I5_9ACTN|nr:MAG: hypothetical protein AVDCRST_MAG41-1305 [uncultured Corynebacteriales bacterium]
MQLHDLLAAAERWYLALAHRNPAYLRQLTSRA